MHLHTLKLQRFRSCADVSVTFQPQLTVLVGENNGGKTNIIDGIRLLTLPLSGRRERYCEDDDLRRGSTESHFALEGHFSGLNDTLKGLLISAVPDPTTDRAVFGMRYQTRISPSIRGRSTFWSGRFETSEPEAGSTELIRHVYLPPLRDAKAALGSGSATRIAALLQNFLQDGEEEGFLTHVRRTGEPHRVLTAINTDIGSALSDLTRGAREQVASVGFSSEALADVARDLRFKLADAGMPAADIRLSGLGYANLLYMATVVVELAKARESDLTLFLVEEPEAHLHPQLQMLVLDFLLHQAKKSAERTPDPGHPEGRIQVIVTTHSPNLTAWVAPEHLVAIRSIPEAGAAPPAPTTTAIPIVALGIEKLMLGKISRYLDVTRSALLFGTRAILVEGVAEALLLPVLARKLVLQANEHALQRFRGAVVVAIDGVDFAPYVHILLHPSGGATIADRVVIVTDADPASPGNRKADLEALAAAWGVADRLAVLTNSVTLEHELFAAGNENVFRQVFLAMRPQSEQRWDIEVGALPVADRPAAFVELLKGTRIRKGDFAQQLAERIESGTDFQVPTYLRDAILSVAAG